MILVDTNVISDVMRAVPAAVVLDWFARHEPTELFLGAISEAELRRGLLPFRLIDFRSPLIDSPDIGFENAGERLPSSSTVYDPKPA